MADEPVQLKVPSSIWRELRARAAADRISTDEALRRAIWLYTHVRAGQDQGSKLLLESADGADQQVVSLTPKENAGG